MQLTIPTPADFSFLETVSAHGWRRLAPFIWREEEMALERVHEFGPGQPTLVRIQEVDGALKVAVDREVDPALVSAAVGRMLQLDINLDSFHTYCSEHPELSHIPGLRQGRLLRSPTLYEDCLKVIATTNTTWSQTIAMTDRLVENFGSGIAPSVLGFADSTSPTSREEKVEASNNERELRSFPRPEQIASVPLDEFAAKAKMGYRNQAVHRISTDIAEGKLDLESWQDPSIPSPDLFKKLLSLPGIGPYAASCLMIYLGRYDRVNVDSWARMMVSKELGRPVTDKEVHAFFEPYGDWKALVYHFYKWKEEEPAY